MTGAGLGVERGVMLAGMGGVSGPRLAAAVAASGGLGVVGAFKATGAELNGLVDPLLAATAGTVGVSLVPEAVSAGTLDAQLLRILGHTPDRLLVVSFGTLPDVAVARLRAAGRRFVVQVGSVDAAGRALAAGAYAVVAQGAQAGGRLLGDTPTAELVAAVRRRHPDAVVVAAGGIATPDDAAAVAQAGADAVCCGTAFVPAEESDAHETYKDRVVAAGAVDTTVTDVFDLGWAGRRHRVLSSRVTADPGRYGRTHIGTTEVAGRSHPVYRFSATVPTRFTEGLIDDMAMYAGHSCEGVRGRSTAAEIVNKLANALEDA
ncbi:nitronate monooxygenase [Streptomyces sp. NPDC058297]|uniref:nitronate monooxygenase n=1 Tax=unclassified Streptomyces TaxID=2593676 RepID=UPI0036EC3F99